MNSQERVSVIGLGYIGLPTACLIASRGIEVIGVDISKNIVDTINAGHAHIVEPGLDRLIEAVVASGHLRATVAPEPADVFLIAVPTPFHDGHKPDISFVKMAVESIAPRLRKGNLIILESTSPVGTTQLVSSWLANCRRDLSFPHQSGETAEIEIAYCPERVLPGAILDELIANDRVIGGLTQTSSVSAIRFYKTFVKGECILTDSATAEMCKLTENSFRDVNIAFANELSQICDKLGIDVWALIALANRHPRVNILNPGPGVGGHCIAVDPWFIVDSCPSEAKLIKMAREINDAKPHYLISRILDAANGHGISRIAFFGMTYKPNVDDFRESPSLEIVKNILDRLEIDRIMLVEPYAKDLKQILPEFPITQLVTIEEALEKANLLVMLVDHDDFLAIPAERMSGKKIIDSRGCWNKYVQANLLKEQCIASSTLTSGG